MLESLEIKNFQQFDVLRLDFGKITTLKGETNSGKSTVLRALEWVCLNQTPQGTDFVRWHCPYVRVILEIDGHRIVRRYGDKNIYKLDRQPTFKAVGHAVPDEIAEIVTTGDVNFQHQIDSLFWFAESASETSRKLNAIIDLAVIDESLARGASMIRGAKAKEAAASELKEELKVQCAQNKWIEDAVKEVDVLSEYEREGLKYRERIIGLTGLIGIAKEITKAAVVPIIDFSEFDLISEAVLSARQPMLRLKDLVEELAEWIRKKNGAVLQLHEAEAALQSLLGEKCPLCGLAIAAIVE